MSDKNQVMNTDDELASETDSEDESIIDDIDAANTDPDATAKDSDEDIGVSIKSAADIEREGVVFLKGYDNKKGFEKLKRERAPAGTKIVNLGVVYEDLPDKGLNDEHLHLHELAILKTPDGQYCRALPLSPDDDADRTIYFLKLTHVQERNVIRRCATAASIKCDYQAWAKVDPGTNLNHLEGATLALFGNTSKHICLSSELQSKVSAPSRVKRKLTEQDTASEVPNKRKSRTPKRIQPTVVEKLNANSVLVPPPNPVESRLVDPKPAPPKPTTPKPVDSQPADPKAHFGTVNLSFESPDHMMEFFNPGSQRSNSHYFRPARDTELTLHFSSYKDFSTFVQPRKPYQH